jgi:putative heme-binding domain-containing protein
MNLLLRTISMMVLLGILAPTAWAWDKKEPPEPWRQWIEPDFPFFSSAVDARSSAAGKNLTPRALVFPLGQDCFLAYDVDLLRVAVVWKAAEVPFLHASMAVHSYPYGGNKVGAGQDKLPKPNGEIWFENGLYPGVGPGQPQFTDPRPPQPSKEEVGRGGLDPRRARFLGIDLTEDAIDYQIGGVVRVRERFFLDRNGLVRQLKIAAHTEPVYLVLANQPPRGKAFQIRGPGTIEIVKGHVVCRIPPATKEETLAILFPQVTAPQPAGKPVTKRWKQVVRLPLPAVQDDRALNLEVIPLPLDNPYKRGVRAAAVDFFKDGRAALVTFDGDVWLAEGLRPGSKEVTWTRFTSGLHEPLSIRVRNEELFVFDRSGLWRLQDRDRNGEADYHELFCSQIDQTAETREFASDLQVEKDGSFLVCKPGQTGSTIGRSSSAILHISRDGSKVTRVAHGFRQPFLGYDPVTGQIAASDQQGNFVPSTPVDFIQQGAFYGFPNDAEDAKRPITPPLTWIPHQVCGSAMSILWMRNAKMGPLNDAPVLLSYHPPRLFQIHTDVDEFIRQGGVTPLDLPVESAPLLKAALNPADGLLYLVGFKIWGTKAKDVTFLGRVRPNPARTWTIPRVARTAKRGILLQFHVPLDPAPASQPLSYEIRRWNYKRTKEYGSAHYRLDGSKGMETLPVASAKLSSDGRSVFLGIPNMREVMQIEVSYNIAARDGTPIQHQTFLTAHLLRTLDLSKLGFADNEVDLHLKAPPVVRRPAVTPSVDRGRRYYTQLGCVGCHSIDGSMEGKTGTSWLGLYGSKRKLTRTGELVTADEAYLRESIMNPSAKVAEGAVNGEAGMPIYEGVLSEEQIDSLLLYIKALASKEALTGLEPPPPRVDHHWKVADFRDELARPLRGRSFEQGKQVFLGASCFACHQIGGKGGQVGPDLSKLDEKMRGLELLTHILEPARRIEDPFKGRVVTTVKGKVYTGFVVAEDKNEIRLTPEPLGKQPPTVISKDTIDEVQLSNVSAMPDGALNPFDKQQVLDLLAYIESGGNPHHPAFAPPPTPHP